MVLVGGYLQIIFNGWLNIYIISQCLSLSFLTATRKKKTQYFTEFHRIDEIKLKFIESLNIHGEKS